jgi:SHAQKYF class myb-like DNA-binding protein
MMHDTINLENQKLLSGNSDGESLLPSVKDECEPTKDNIEEISKDLPPILMSEIQQEPLNILKDDSYENDNSTSPTSNTEDITMPTLQSRKRRRKSSTSSIESYGEDDGEKKKKKQRLHWTSDLHNLFVSAVNQLGIESKITHKSKLTSYRCSSKNNSSINASTTTHQRAHQESLTSKLYKNMYLQQIEISNELKKAAKRRKYRRYFWWYQLFQSDL